MSALHHTELTAEQIEQCLEDLLKHGTMVHTANDDEDGLTWITLNARKVTASVRSDGFVSFYFNAHHDHDGRLKSSHRSVRASELVDRERLKPLFMKFLPNAYPGHVKSMVEEILGGETVSPKHLGNTVWLIEKVCAPLAALAFIIILLKVIL